MAYNKFIKKDGTIMLDLTDTTVSSTTLGKNITAVDKYGNKIIGTLTDSPIPIEVSTEEEMTALLESGEVGSVYKYIGTTDTYENNALYEIVEAQENDPLQGIWLFNDTITLPSTSFFHAYIDFTTFDEFDTFTFKSFATALDGGNILIVYYEGRDIDINNAFIAYRKYSGDWDSGGWEHTFARQITINTLYSDLTLSEDSGTPEEFLSWLQTNATKQEEVTKSFTKLILQSDLEEITITENGEYEGEYSNINVEVNTFPTYITTKEKPNDFSKLFYYSTINDTQLNTLMNGLDTSSVTNMSHMFDNCYNLTTIPLLDTSNVTNMNSMFNMYPQSISQPNLTSIPQLNTSNVTDMGSMFEYCTNLTTIPQLDTSNVTNMESMFSLCTNLTTIPQLDTSNVTNMSYMFYLCSNLTSIPQLDTSNVTNMEGMFDTCVKLTTIPPLDVSNAENMYDMFLNCTNLTSITFINMENTTADYHSLFYDCPNLKSLIMSGAKKPFNISYFTQFETQDLVNLIDSLGTITDGSRPTLFMGSVNYAKLSSEQRAVATNKGWFISPNNH